MQNKLIKYLATKVPPTNIEGIRRFPEDTVADIPNWIEEMAKSAIRTLQSQGVNDFVYRGFRLLSPTERLDRLLREKNWLRIYQIRPTSSIEYSYMFEHEGVNYDMTTEVPFTDNCCIKVKGVSSYPLLVITDKGGLSRMDDKLYLETLRVTMIFERDKFKCMKSSEGNLIYASIIRTQLHYGSKGIRKCPPLLLYLFATQGLDATLSGLGVLDDIILVDQVIEEDGVLHLPIGKNLYVKIRNYKSDNLQARVALSISDILEVFSHYTCIDDIKSAKFFRTALGAYTQAGMLDDEELEDHAISHLSMCESSLDGPSKKLHGTIGLVYDNFYELIQSIFLSIDERLMNLKKYRTSTIHKRVCGAQLLMSGVIYNFHKDLYDVLKSTRDSQKISKLKRLTTFRSFQGSLHGSETYEPVSTMYNDNIMPHITKRKLVLHSADLSSGPKRGRRKGKASGKIIPVEFLRFHSSYPLTMGMYNYPSSKPITTGSLVPFVRLDENGGIIPPDCWKEYCDIYGDNPEKKV